MSFGLTIQAKKLQPLLGLRIKHIKKIETNQLIILV